MQPLPQLLWRRVGVGLALSALVFWITAELSAGMRPRGAAVDEHGAIHYRDTPEAVIALTFDDGPDPVITPKILDVLKAYGAHATFFVIGERAERYPAIVQRIVAEGHELGNHGFSHAYKTMRSVEKIVEEIERTRDALRRVAGIETRHFRPPGGFHNARIVKAAALAGHDVIMWSWNQDSRDWARPGVTRIVRTVLDNARPGDIVLFHDGPGQEQTVAALGEILSQLSARHFRTVTISELLAETTPATAGPAP